MDAAARSQAGDLMALYDARYFIMHPPIPGRFPYQDTWQTTQAYALEVLPLEQPAYWSQDGIAAYRVVQPPIPSPFKLDLSTAGTEPYLGAGWDLWECALCAVNPRRWEAGFTPLMWSRRQSACVVNTGSAVKPRKPAPTIHGAHCRGPV